MRLIDNDRVVLTQVPIMQRLGQQDAVGHQLDRCALREFLVEPDLVANVETQRRTDLLGNAACHCSGCDATRLRMPNQPLLATPSQRPPRGCCLSFPEFRHACAGSAGRRPGYGCA